MKSIEERAYDRYTNDECYRDCENCTDRELCLEADDVWAFIEGARSEHQELTKWNSPDNPPNNRGQVLLKVKTDFTNKIYYKIGNFIQGNYCESYSGMPLKTNCLGWREIHE